MSALTAREQVFVRLVHTTHNKTQAYLDAGYRCSRETAAANAHRLLGKSRVQKALATLAAARVERLEQQGDELELAAHLMRFTVLDLYDAAWMTFHFVEWARLSTSDCGLSVATGSEEENWLRGRATR